MKPASEVSKAAHEAAKDAGKAETTTEVQGEKSEKRPHTPRSGLVLKTSEEVRSQAGEKAPHGESSENDDEQLAVELPKASSVTLTPRQGTEQRSGPRSDEVDYDEEEDRTVPASSKATVWRRRC